MRITSLQNPRVKEALRLRRGQHRHSRGQILIDGGREIDRALRSGVAVSTLFVCPSRCHTAEARQIAASPPTGIEVLEASEQVFQKLAFGQGADGVVALAAPPQRRLEDLALPVNPLVAVIEGVEKPGNLGAILRSADGAGIDAIVAADARTDLYNPNAIRASLGTVFTLPLCAASTVETIAWLRRAGVTIYTARVNATRLYTNADYRGPSAIVLGSEASGLSSAWQSEDVLGIRLPMAGLADSLNVSATAAILFYEARRQRSQPDGPTAG